MRIILIARVVKFILILLSIKGRKRKRADFETLLATNPGFALFVHRHNLYSQPERAVALYASK